MNDFNKWIYNSLEIKKNLNIGNNLNILSNLTTDSLLIKNNGIFNSNINIQNFITKITKQLEIENNFILHNSNLSVKNNTISKGGINFSLNEKNTILNIKKNINVSSNLNIGLFNVKRNLITKKQIFILKNLLVNNNLNHENNLNVKNINHKSEFNINNDITVSNIKINENLNIKSKLYSDQLTIDKGIFVNKDFIAKHGIFKLPYNSELNTTGQITYNTQRDFIIVNINTSNKILTQNSEGYKNKTNINVFNDNFSILNGNKTNIELINENLNIYLNTNILNNSNIFSNLNITNNLNIKNNTTIQNKLLLQKYLQLPTNENPQEYGIRFNNNSIEIANKIDENKCVWGFLKFLDQNNTGIIRHRDFIKFNIKNNNIICFNKNTYINNNTIISNNLNINESIYISNNLQTISNLNIDNVKIQSYNNLLRTYNTSKKKFVSLTLEDYNSNYKIPFKSNTFILKDIKSTFKKCNLSYYINPKDIIINKHYFDINTIIIPYDIILSHIYLNIYTNITTNYIIEIYKNNNLIYSINKLIEKYFDNFIQLNNHINIKKNDNIFVQIKSTQNNIKNSVKLNLLGYSITPTSIKGDSTIISDSKLYFNQSTSYNVPIHFKENVNVLNNINLHKSSDKNICNANTLHINNHNSYNLETDLLNINDNFIINKLNLIDIGTKSSENSNSYISLYSTQNAETALKNTGGMAVLSNINSLNLIAQNINVINNTNIITLSTTNSDIFNNDLTLLNNINTNKSIYNYGNLNISENNYLKTENIILNTNNENDYASYSKNIVCLYNTNNNNLGIVHYNYSSSALVKNIYHKNIKTINNNININNLLNITENNISILNNNSTNIFDLGNTFKPIMQIVPNGNTYLFRDLLINSKNFNKRLTTLIYDMYGLTEPVIEYNLKDNLNDNNNVKLYNNSINISSNIYKNYQLYKNFTLTESNITIIYKDNINYYTLNTLLTYEIQTALFSIDIIYFKNIELIDNNIRSFSNNIKSYILHNPYNYDVDIYYDNHNVIYPKFITNINQNKHNYGLKTIIL